MGIIDSYDKLMHSCFREGTKSESDIKAIHNFMDLAPRLTMNELGKTKPSLGSISSVLVRSDKGVFVFSRLDEFIIVVGLDVEILTPVPELVARLIKSAASRSPDLPSPSETVEAATVENSRQDA